MEPPAGYQLPPVLAVAILSRRFSAATAEVRLPATTDPIKNVKTITIGMILFLISFLLICFLKIVKHHRLFDHHLISDPFLVSSQ
jgi:hypothetical protein